MKKLKFKRDVEFINRDWNDNFDHSKMIIKKNTIIDVDEDEFEVKSYPWGEFDKFYHITFEPYNYKKENVIFEIIQESEEDENDVEELRSQCCFICINVDDVEEIEINDIEQYLKDNDIILHKIYYLMNAYWYGSEDVKDGVIDLSMSFEQWSKEMFIDYKTTESLKECLTLYNNKL